MRALLPIVALALSGCSFLFEGPQKAVACRTNRDCSANEVCFADGCGDPGSNVVVEVTPNAAAGQNEQDYPVPQLAASLNLQLFQPSQIVGTVSVAGSSGSTAYSGTAAVLLNGWSYEIPGQARQYQPAITIDRGAYSAPTGSGVFLATLQTDDPTYPPQQAARIYVAPGFNAEVDWTLPDPSTLVTIKGFLVVADLVAPLPAQMRVQAFDAQTLVPLSQASLVAADHSFRLNVYGQAALQGSLLIRATPVNPNALVPAKDFVLARGDNGVTLALGDYGSPTPFRGTVLTPDGAPLRGATTYLDGTVADGGHFRSASVVSDADGGFALTSLPSDPTQPQSMNLWVVPPPGVASGLSHFPVDVPLQDGGSAMFTCISRTPISGTVTRPSGAAFAGVHVVAVPLAPIGLHPIPTDWTDTQTNSSGQYTLYLDPAEFRFDFIPAEQLPRTSRFFAVDGTANRVDAQISNGRTLSGSVSIGNGDGGYSPVPFAHVRFFRVPPPDPPQFLQAPATLIAEGFADSNASYQVIVPTSSQ